MVLLFNMLKGRIGPGMCHLFGPAATGKTTIAMVCAAAIAARGKPCAWLDTAGGFSPKRFAQVSLGMTGRDRSSRIMYTRIANPLALDHALEVLNGKMASWLGELIVLDTAFGAVHQTFEDSLVRKILFGQQLMLWHINSFFLAFN